MEPYVEKDSGRAFRPLALLDTSACTFIGEFERMRLKENTKFRCVCLLISSLPGKALRKRVESRG